jgi:spermidine/putrescine-binding protein
MRRTLFIIIFSVMFSFAWGLWFGLYRSEKSRPARWDGPDIRFLIKKGFITDEFVKSYSQKNKVNFQLVEVEDDSSLLRELVSPQINYDIAQVPSYLVKTFLIENVFTPLDSNTQEAMKAISVDFKSLDFDPGNKYLLPMTWGVNGFLVKKETNKPMATKLDDLLNTKASTSISTIANPVDVFYLAMKIRPIIRAWTESGNQIELMRELKEIHKRFGKITEPPSLEVDSDTESKSTENVNAENKFTENKLTENKFTENKFTIQQMPNGLAAKYLEKSPDTYEFVLPEERSRLWINSFAIPVNSKNRRYAARILNSLMQSEWAFLLSKTNSQATTVTALNNSTLDPMLKASYVRELPISRVEFYMDNESLEPTWLDAYRWLKAQ